MIINGQRHPGPNVSDKLANYFKFNESERSYFLGLIHLGKSKNQTEVAFMLKERLQKMNPKKDVCFIDERMFGLLSSWIPYAIREMTKLTDFESTPEWISEHLRFKAGKPAIRKAIADLKALKLVTSDRQGRLRSNDVELDSEPDIENHAVQLYQKMTLDLAKEALRACQLDQRDFSSLTMTINVEDFPEMKKRIRRFLDSIQKDFEVKDSGDATIQLQIQSFPYNRSNHSRSKSKKEKLC
jgi:uncharacterized protein (TIGR02147 family)